MLLRILVPGSVLPGEGAVGTLSGLFKETILIPLLRQEADSEYLDETTLFLLLVGVSKTQMQAMVAPLALPML